MKEKTSEYPTDKQMCFFVTPIGDDGSDIRRQTDGLYSVIIENIAKEYNMEAVVAHKKDTTGDITSSIVNDIYKAKLVIADLTTLNPNVMYEIALRDAMKKPIILIAEKGTKLPFDISTMNTIMYTNDFLGTQELLLGLRSRINKIDFDEYKAVNLITQSEASISLYEEAGSVDNPEVAQVLKGLIKEFEQLKQSTHSLINKNLNKASNSNNLSVHTFKVNFIMTSETEAQKAHDIIVEILQYYSVYYKINFEGNMIDISFSECDTETAKLVYNKIINNLGEIVIKGRKNFQ